MGLHDSHLVPAKRASRPEAAVHYLAGYGVPAAAMLLLVLIAASARGPFTYLGILGATGLVAMLPRQNTHLHFAALIVLFTVATWRFPDIGLGTREDAYEWLQLVFLRAPFSLAVVDIIYLLVLIGWIPWPRRARWNLRASDSPPSRPRVVLGLMVFSALLVVAGVAFRQPVLIEARTQHIRFHPFTIEGLVVGVDRELVGNCEPSRLLPHRSNAWRCVPAGIESALEPCFEDVYGGSARLACVSSPWDEIATMVLPSNDLAAIEHPIPRDSAPRNWAYLLHDGRNCLLSRAGPNEGHAYACDGSGQGGHLLGGIEQKAIIRSSEGSARVPVVKAWD